MANGARGELSVHIVSSRAHGKPIPMDLRRKRDGIGRQVRQGEVIVEQVTW